MMPSSYIVHGGSKRRSTNKTSSKPTAFTKSEKTARSNGWQNAFWMSLLFGTCGSFLVYVFMVPHTGNHDASRIFQVVDLPGRGKGVIALRDINQGELVMREKPVLVLPRALSGVGLDPISYVAQQVQSLSQDRQDAFFNLSYVNLQRDDEPGRAMAIVQTNAVAAGKDNVAVFPTMARLNHGCAGAFNVVYSYRENEGEIVVHALKEVKKGRELLTTYTDTKRPREERRQHLSTQYDFNCDCASCSLPEAESLQSDERLRSMARQYAKLATWSSRKISGSEAIAAVREIWALGEQEGYWSERGQLAADAAHVASAHSEEAARDWAEVAMHWFAYELGVDDERSRGMKRFMMHPEAVAAGFWGTRGHEQVGGPLSVK